MPDEDGDNAALQDEIAEREAFEARFPPEAFSGIAAALGLLSDQNMLSGLRGSLFHPFYFFYVISSGETLSRDDWICGLTEMRDAARTLLKSLRYGEALMTIGSAGGDDPVFDGKFRGTVRSIADRADAKITKLRSERNKGGRPRIEFWEMAPDLIREYRRWTGKEATKPRWLGGSKYAGEFYDFVVAVVDCLRDNLAEPHFLKNLPDSPSAIGDGLRKRWPFDKTELLGKRRIENRAQLFRELLLAPAT
jgi:hypothetical protein